MLRRWARGRRHVHRLRRMGQWRWTSVRWLVVAVGVAALWACTSHRLVAPHEQPAASRRATFLPAADRKLDLLFMVDDSASMQPLQDKLARNLPTLIDRLTILPGGLPDLHIAVISSSVGQDSLSDIAACRPGAAGDGRFQHAIDPTGRDPDGCRNVTLNGNFIRAEAGAAPNFTGEIATVFSCIALLGQKGCGFEHQFVAIEAALAPGQAPPDNAGFLRDDAYLGIVMLTNEDDCSAPQGSALFNMNDTTGLGLRQSYRCAEFGILCNGAPPPHTLGAMETRTLDGCVSAEDRGQLIRVADFEQFLIDLKGDRTRILMAAIASPPAPFAVSSSQSRSSPMAGGIGLVPSCATPGTDDYGDPAVRISQVVGDLGGVSFDICRDDYGPAMNQIADALGKLIGPSCINGNIATRTAAGGAPGAPDCIVTERTRQEDGRVDSEDLPACNTTAPPFAAPCWRLLDSPGCPQGKRLLVCREPTCDPEARVPSPGQIVLECALAP